MSRFPTHQHVAAWAGQCPGNNESAGTHKSGNAPRGNRWLDAVLTEVAQAAARTRGTYFQAQYHHLAPRRGKNRAIGALKHSLLTTIYCMRRDGNPYQDLGADHFTRLNPQPRIRYHVRKLQELGQKVDLSPLSDAA